MAKVAESTMEAESLKEAPEKTKKASTKVLHLPPTPSGTITNSPENFFAYQKQLTADQWSRSRGYLYRLIPAIRRKPSYIDRFTQPINEEYILRHKLGGSGRYQIRLNDRDGAGTFCQCILDLNDPDFPPRYNIHELDLTSDDNRQLIEELKQEGKLNQNGDVIEQKTADSNDGTMAQALKDIAIEAMRGRKEQPGMENQAFSKMMEMMASASKQSIEIALGQVKKDDPASFMALLTTAKELFAAKQEPATNPLDILIKAKELFGAPAKPAEDPLMKLLMAQLEQAQKDASAERQRNHELQLKMLEAKATAADPMDMVEKVLNIQEKLGGGQREPRNWKEKLVDQGFAALPDILNAVKGYTQRSQQPFPVRVQQPAPVQQQTQQHPPSAAPSSGQQAQPQQPEQPQLDSEVGWLAKMFETRGPDFVLAFRADPLGGGEAAAPLIKFAPTIHERIARMGLPKILEAIECLPQMKVDLFSAGATQEMLNDFIEDFIAGPEDPDEDPDEDGDGDNGDPEPGFADPANPDDRKPNRNVGPKIQRKKVPA